MKKHITLFFVLFMGLALAAEAQQKDYLFKVLGSKGQNSADGVSLKIGSVLQANQKLSVGEGSYIDLAHQSGKAINLRSQGVYQVQELASKVSTMPSVTSKYADYVIQEITKDDGLSAAKNRFQHMNKTGSVTRGSHIFVKIVLPDNEATELYGDKLGLSWLIEGESAEEIAKKDYLVVITTTEDEILSVQTIAGLHASIDLSGDVLKNENSLVLRVFLEDKNTAINKKMFENTEGRAILRMTDNTKRGLIAKDIQEINNGEETPFSLLITARMFEENKLYADASAAYQKAYELSEKSDYYLSAYLEFQNRILQLMEAESKN